MQNGNTSDMIFSVAARKPPVFIRPGDVCEIEVEGIGILRNPVLSA
jgi:2-keto-4-pentenoate hydratase/2-oxohepta-3-ene-1,7-dioic acid hydratase in catechol pathway